MATQQPGWRTAAGAGLRLLAGAMQAPACREWHCREDPQAAARGAQQSEHTNEISDAVQASRLPQAAYCLL